ncbi:MAG: hypothetical protein J07HX5_02054 [halophilic archaeon J07HX5]|nr:MAG: hypothetical protein J07HX5_02054 [halophilic archaeon J07HX5]
MEYEAATDGILARNTIDDCLAVDDQIVRVLVVVPKHEDVLDGQQIAVVSGLETAVETCCVREHSNVVDLLASVANQIQRVAVVGEVVAQLHRDVVDPVCHVLVGGGHLRDRSGVRCERDRLSSVGPEQRVRELDVGVDERTVAA